MTLPGSGVRCVETGPVKVPSRGLLCLMSGLHSLHRKWTLPSLELPLFCVGGDGGGFGLTENLAAVFLRSLSDLHLL